jgi:hypothetical protein
MRQKVFSMLITVFVLAGLAVVHAGSYDSGTNDWLEEDARDWQRTYEPANVPNSSQYGYGTGLPPPITPSPTQQQRIKPSQSRQKRQSGGILSILFPWWGRKGDRNEQQQSQTTIPSSENASVNSKPAQRAQNNLVKPHFRGQGSYSLAPSTGRSSRLIKPKIVSYGAGGSPSSDAKDLRNQQPHISRPKYRNTAVPSAKNRLIKPTIPHSNP